MQLGTRLAILAGACVLAAGTFPFVSGVGQAEPVEGFQVAVDASGAIHVPDVDYRKDWAVLGTWAVAADADEGSKGIHVVYTQPETVAVYRKDGAFPDGAVLIKELLSTTTEAMTTGTVSRAKDVVGWFVMVKDSGDRYPDNPLWGDGWGWSFFDAADRTKTTSTNYKTDCIACHVPVQKTDWVYVQGYPALHGR